MPMIGKTLANYKITSQLGRGDMAEVIEESKLLESSRERERNSTAGAFRLRDARSSFIQTVILLSPNTAMRDSEMRTLRWEQIDFLDSIATIPGRTNAVACYSEGFLKTVTTLFTTFVAGFEWGVIWEAVSD